MLWLKGAAAVAAVAFGVLIGYLAAERYRSRKQFFAQWQSFNERYLNELKYARRPLPQFLGEYAYGGAFQKRLAAFSARSAAPPLPFLTEDEKKQCDAYFGMLGKGDAASQSGYFAARQDTLAQKRAESEKEAKARGALYLKLGLLAGLAFVILII